MKRSLLGLSCLLGLMSGSLTVDGQDAPQESKADRWEAAVKSFEDQDAKSPLARGANLFVGSSSIRLWKLETSFPENVCLNRGFGGSHLSDSARYAERLVIPYKPRVVVVYAGDNDIASGKTANDVFASYRELRDKIQSALPDAKIVFVCIKPSPSRWKLRDEAIKANKLIQEEIEKGKNQIYIDVWNPMLGSDGMPRPELYVKDQLHMSETGYSIWNKLVEPHLASMNGATK